MWRQLVASMTGLVLSWSPMPGAPVPPSQPPAVSAPAAGVRNPNLRSGREAIQLALEEVTQVLVDQYYKRYGGMFVTRSLVERKVRSAMKKRQAEISSLIHEKFMGDGVPVQFDTETEQVIYSKNHCIRKITVSEIAGTMMDLQERLRKDS